MVKFGEFSPLNPDLQCTGKSLLGLGEYEERRRVLLEKKKREYREQMAQARALQKTGTLTGNNHHHHMKNEVNLRESAEHEIQHDNRSITNLQSESPINRTSSPFCKQADISTEGECLPFISTPQEMNHLELLENELSLPPLSPGTLSISARDRKLADLRESFSEMLNPATPRSESLAALSRRSQDLYQDELRRQIEEKRRLEAVHKEQEKREEEAMARRLAKQQEQMRRELEWEEAQKKALAEKRAKQMEEVTRRQEELEKEAAELRKKTKRKVHKHQGQDTHNSDVHLESRPGPTMKSENLRTPAVVKSDRHKEELNGHPSACNGISPVSGTINDQFRYTANDGKTMRLKLYRSENQSSKVIGTNVHRGMNRVSQPTRDHQLSAQKENIDIQFQHDRSPLKMLQNLGKDHNFEDTLPIPVFRSRSPVVPAVRHRTSLERVSRSPIPRRYSEGMQMLEFKWQVPAVEKNNLQTTDRFQQARHNNELTQLGAFRRQLQLEQLRMDEMLQQQQSMKKA